MRSQPLPANMSMKKTLIIIAIPFLILIIFRGSIFRLTVKYNEIGSRPEIEITNSDLLDRIEAESKNKTIDLSTIVDIAKEITTEELSFTTNNASNNPNGLINTNQANCVGYSAMFNSITNHLIRKHNLHAEIEAEHKIGHLELIGANVHRYFNSPFFKDHDFNEITNKRTGEKICVDPSVSDYFWISRVAKKKNSSR